MQRLYVNPDKEMCKRQALEVSVVISTFKRPDRILSCLNSVLSQTVLPKEIIIVHDGPGPETRTSLENSFFSYLASGFLRFFETDKWYGRPAAPRNCGWAIAAGDLVAFCDDDDFWFPTKLEEQIKVMSSEPSVAAVFSDYEPVPYGQSDKLVAGGDNVPQTSLADRARIDVEALSLRSFLMGSGLCLSSALVRRDAIPAEFFPEAQKVKAFEDYCAWLKLATARVDLRVIRAALVGYVMDNPTSIRGSKISHNIRLSHYVTGELVRSGNSAYLFFFFLGRFSAALRVLRPRLL